MGKRKKKCVTITPSSRNPKCRKKVFGKVAEGGGRKGSLFNPVKRYVGKAQKGGWLP